MLERSHDALPALESSPWSSKAGFEEAVHSAFSRAGRLAPGFTPLFESASEAVSNLPDSHRVLTSIRTFLEDLEAFPLESIEPDIFGTIFEPLIPWVRRHQLGQFYTPALVADVLVQWAVRRPTDRVLDPACGPGIILAKAYERLRSLKKGCADYSPASACGGDSFSQLYGFDVDPAAIRLAAASLAMQDFSSRLDTTRFIVEDFFNILPLETTTGKDSSTDGGEVSRQGASIPLFDAVVTNPPYTRWSELPGPARRRIREKLGDILRAYSLSPERGWGVEAGLHIYFVLWAHRFLRAGGRLAMIVSDSWLQTDFGTAFGQFLLDHFRVRAVVDLGARVFPSPMVGTCLLLLEREDDPAARTANTTRFIYLDATNGDSRFDVETVLQGIDGIQPHSPNLSIREVAQREIPASSKWIQNVFDVEACLKPLRRSPLMIRLESLCDVAYGNAKYLVLTSKGAIHGVPNVGGERFFYLSDNDAHTWRLSPPWVHPLLPSGRYAQSFSFTKTDWEALRTRSVPCWLFTAHRSRKLPRLVSEYIRHGDRSVRLRGMKRSDGTAKTVSQSLASSTRRRHPQYFEGWFDVGGIEPAPIFAIRGTQHRSRFVLADFPVGLDDRLIALIPKAALDGQQLKALVASLNSTFSQLQIEATCRTTGGGMVELDLRHAAALLTPDITRLSSKTVTALAKLFEELERKTRRLGGANRKIQLDALAPVFDEIDTKLAGTIGLAKPELLRIQELTRTLGQRRLTRVTAPMTAQDTSL